MALFWRRKKEDRYITLGLNEPAAKPDAKDAAGADKGASLETPAGASEAGSSAATTPVTPPALEPVPTGAQPTPPPAQETGLTDAAKKEVIESPRPVPPAPTKPAARETDEREGQRIDRAATPPTPAQARPATPSRSPFSTSILGLDRSMEELQAEEAALEQAFANRFRRAVSATRESLSEKIDTVFQGRKQIDAELLDELEEALIAADIGVETTVSILDTVRRGVTRKEINDIAALKAAIKNQLLSILKESAREGVESEASVPEDVTPYVIMVVGVNGVGKTTTIGKLAQRIKADGNDVLICAADTFRAAASDQLAIWAERTGVPLIQQKQGTDPAAVLFDALKAAKARNSDVLIVDTAGRLHNKSNLMAELEKMKRIAGREVSGAPHETLLVVDAVTGQNGLEQARQFLKVAGVTGIVLTKLDGTAKGGIAVAIARELRLPIRYAGIGEKVDDLVVFDSEQYVNSLFE
ncbi:MAG TPA: signal recognition particle-docking protein FtsY [Pyrinomonadaceae bacterium]|jgi:fused signal recognition particle receptor|nr:signal recognition particle-docking protein FtsY [Pyrinomonadaceae bacterium]